MPLQERQLDAQKQYNCGHKIWHIVHTSLVNWSSGPCKVMHYFVTPKSRLHWLGWTTLVSHQAWSAADIYCESSTSSSLKWCKGCSRQRELPRGIMGTRKMYQLFETQMSLRDSIFNDIRLVKFCIIWQNEGPSFICWIWHRKPMPVHQCDVVRLS